MKVVNVPSVGVLLAAGLTFCAGLAQAQNSASTQTPQAQADQAATAPLKLDVPPPDLQAQPLAGGTDSPGVYYGDHSGAGKDEGDDNDNDNKTQVHGSFTTGIGYSKGYGTSTMNAGELHISKQYDDGKTFDMQINVQQSKGPGFSPYGYYGGYYGPRYR